MIDTGPWCNWMILFASPDIFIYEALQFFPVGDPWFDFLLGERVISIEIFQRILHEFISFISKLFYVLIRRVQRYALRIMKFLLHWFKDSFETAGNSKFELCSGLRCSMVRLSYLKKWSGIILYSHQNYDFRKRNPEVYILCRKVQVFCSKFNLSSFASLILDRWWTVTYITYNITIYFKNISIKLHALRKILQTR